MFSIWHTSCQYTYTHTFYPSNSMPAGESHMGPVVNMIMDHPRCAQLQEGDVLMEVNGENVRGYVHNELMTVLKRCPKGNQATFVVLRQPNEVRMCSGVRYSNHFV